MSGVVIMVHGAFCGGWTFEAFRRPFEARGWRVLTPDLPGHGAAEPSDAVVGLSMADYADAVAKLCAAQDRPPVLLGHSLGGLVSAMAARKVALDSLVLLAPSPPWGIAGLSVEEAVTAVGVQMLTPFSNGAVEPDRNLMRQYSLDRMSPEAAAAVTRRMRPESARALSETLNWWLDPFMTTGVATAAPVPSLVLTGERDKVHTVSTVRQAAQRFGAELRVMPQMSHWLPGEPGWEVVADEAIGWLSAGRRRAA